MNCPLYNISINRFVSSLHANANSKERNNKTQPNKTPIPRFHFILCKESMHKISCPWNSNEHPIQNENASVETVL